jgi:hypothetical protein
VGALTRSVTQDNEPVATILSLQVVEGIEVKVVLNTCIGGRQVQSQAARFGREQKDWY